MAMTRKEQKAENSSLRNARYPIKSCKNTRCYPIESFSPNWIFRYVRLLLFQETNYIEHKKWITKIEWSMCGLTLSFSILFNVSSCWSIISFRQILSVQSFCMFTKVRRFGKTGITLWTEIRFFSDVWYDVFMEFGHQTCTSHKTDRCGV